MDLLRSIGFLFLFVVVPLGAMLANFPGPIAHWLSELFGFTVTRGNLGAAFLLVTVICLKVDLTRRRRAQARSATI
ncbi:hypothetical protein ACX0MV_02440 [Pseudomonas borbori]